jgi:2'-5' RNA ligase
MTLYSLGMHVGVTEILVRAASEAAAAVAAVIPPFKVTFARALSFAGRPGNRPFVLRDSSDNTALVEFRRRLGAALDNCGVPHTPHSAFTPHLTLLYSKQSAAEESIEAVSWLVNEFVLVHSLVGKTIHNHLAHWTLQG